MARKICQLDAEVPQTKNIWGIKVAGTGPAPQLVT